MNQIFLTLIWQLLLLNLFHKEAQATQAEPLRSHTTFTVKSSVNKIDRRHNYDIELLTLALEKTRVTHGSYVLVNNPSLNLSRAIHVAQKNQLTNFVLKLSYIQDAYKDLIYAKFPVELGIVGYRVCFAHHVALRQLSAKPSLQELRRFTYGVSIGWADTKILRHNNFRVLEIPEYASMFSMLSNGEYDLFCRGANEVYTELQHFKYLGNFELEPKIALHYPLPRFFYSHRTNLAAVQRIEKGLKIAYSDGSLFKLWSRHYLKSIEVSKLNSRRVFFLQNPNLGGLSESYKQYLYKPLEDRRLSHREANSGESE